MVDGKEDVPIVRVAGKDSVNMALELLRSASNKSAKRKRNEKSDNKFKVSSHCSLNLVGKKDNIAAQGFFETYAITEMRSSLARRDWASLRELFPLLLGCYSEIEPIIWRYAFTLLLCSPDSHPNYFQEFIEMCIGAQSVEDSYLLERLLTLPNENT